MEFVIRRDALFKPLQLIVGVTEKRQTMPILAHALLVISNKQLSLTGTDTEIELIVDVAVESITSDANYKVAVPARKLLDICRVLPENALLNFYQESESRIIVRSERSRFVLSTLPATEFPNIEWEKQSNIISQFKLPQNELRYLIESTCFAMAQNEARYYLNGLLLENKNNMMWAVGADGHRMALNGIDLPEAAAMRVIVPYKGVIELLRSLDDSSEELSLSISDNHIRVIKSGLVFTSKLIDGQFPEYERIIPRDGDKKFIVESEAFKQALSRVAVLSNDLFCGVQLEVKTGVLHMYTSGKEQETADAEIKVDYQGETIKIGFNIHYLLDVFNSTNAEKMVATFKDSSSSILLEEPGNSGNNLYVIMPLRV